MMNFEQRSMHRPALAIGVPDEEVSEDEDPPFQHHAPAGINVPGQTGRKTAAIKGQRHGQSNCE